MRMTLIIKDTHGNRYFYVDASANVVTNWNLGTHRIDFYYCGYTRNGVYFRGYTW